MINWAARLLTASNCNLTVKGAGLGEMRGLSFIIRLLTRFVIMNLLRAFFQPLSLLKHAVRQVKRVAKVLDIITSI
jgi:hypothetical protein